MQAGVATPQIKWTRWWQAQEYEQHSWKRRALRIENGTEEQLNWYDWKARRLEQRLASLPHPRPRTGRILEIGSGPIGLVNSLEWGERYAIDPLEEFYNQTPSLVRLRRPGATYLIGTGEWLPFEDASCALVIIENVLDHTYAPAKILQEISRVLEPGGDLYLLVNVRTRGGALLHHVVRNCRVDSGHPHTFTSAGLRRMLSQHGLTILKEERGSYEEARQAHRQSTSLKTQAKAYAGLSEFSHAFFCRKHSRHSSIEK